MTALASAALRADDELTVEDHFCGAGGSTTGAMLVDGVRVVHAANHSKIAISTHSHNYPEVEHSLADIPSMDPRRVPKAAVLITSPECRARSYARGRPKDDPHLFKPGDGLDERSRATMWEVPRFAEVRRYQAIVVENVPQTVDWCEPTLTGHHEKCNCGVTFRGWLADMASLSYEHRKLFWNSAFFPPTPQSRDRLYIVFWRAGQRPPDLDHHPVCWCNVCEQLVDGVQTMKPHLRRPPQVAKAWGPHDTVWGRYGAQYFYACMRCGARAVPAITPAATAVDWAFPAERIGDRAEPLAINTMARIQRGLDRLADRPLVVPLDYLTEPHSRTCRSATGDVLPTVHGQHKTGLVVQVAGNLGRLHADGSIDRAALEKSWPTDQPLRTIHGSVDRALVVSNQRGNVPDLASGEPMGAVTTRNTHGLVVAMRENAVPKVADDEPMQTATTINSIYAVALPRLVVSNMNNNVPRVADDEEMATVTTGAKLYAVDPWIVPLRRNTKAATRVADEAMPTIVAGGNQHYLLEPPGTKGHAIVTLRGDGQAHHIEDPLLTCATVEQHTLVSAVPNILDCTFRMLEPSEIGRGMVMHLNARGEPYVVHGNRRDQVKQFGNAVTPPPMRRIIIAIRDALS